MGIRMREKLTPAFVAKAPLPERGDRVIYWDAAQKGFGLVVTAAGHRSYVVQYRARGMSRRMSCDDVLSLSAARQWAKIQLGNVASGGDPLTEKRKAASAAGNTLRSIAESYFQRDGKKLRSIVERRKVFERLIYPKFGGREVSDIRRSEIVALLDKIEDQNGPRMAHVVLAYLSKLFNWHAKREDDFHSPIVRGMGRINATERARKRILTDDELRAVWTAAEASGTLFDRYVQFLLLTAVRRMEATRMTRAELAGADWLIPASRIKGKRDHLVPLSQAALDVLAKLPVLGKSDGFVFTNDGVRPAGDYTNAKADLQKRSGTSGWTLHDLRRTARSLMSRAGVESDHAEQCLGHILAGVRGTYDRHTYHAEKKAAFEKLAEQIDCIVHPPTDNVLQLPHRRSSPGPDPGMTPR
jgi:integrase